MGRGPKPDFDGDFKSSQRLSFRGARNHPTRSPDSLLDFASPHYRKPSTLAGRAHIVNTHVMLTRGITARISGDAVIDTTELLERIILQLPLADILTCRGICKSWNQMIMASPQIQIKMFLRPSPTGHFWVFDPELDVLKLYDASESRRAGLKWSQRQYCMHPTELNPLLFARKPQAQTAPLHERARCCENIMLTVRPDLNRAVGSSLIHHMYVTQPPVETMEFLFYHYPTKVRRSGMKFPLLSTRLKIRKRTGIKFGHVIEEFLKHVQTSDGFPGYGHQIRLRAPGRSKKNSTVWMLGAIFVSEEEKAAIEAQAA